MKTGNLTDTLTIILYALSVVIKLKHITFMTIHKLLIIILILTEYTDTICSEIYFFFLDSYPIIIIIIIQSKQ